MHSLWLSAGLLRKLRKVEAKAKKNPGSCLPAVQLQQFLSLRSHRRVCVATIPLFPILSAAGPMHRGGSGHSSYASSQERRPSTTASSEVPPTMTAGGSTLSFESVEQYDYGTNSWTAYSTPHEPVAALAGTSLSGYAGCPPPPPPHGGQAPLSFSYPPHQPSHHAYGMYDHSYDYNNDVVLAAVDSARWEYQTAAGLDQQQGSHIDPSFQLPPAVQPPPEPAMHVEPVKTRQPRTHRRHRSDEAPSITSSGLALPAATVSCRHCLVPDRHTLPVHLILL